MTNIPYVRHWPRPLTKWEIDVLDGLSPKLSEMAAAGATQEEMDGIVDDALLAASSGISAGSEKST
jgi:hypothetical protein